MAKFRIRDSDPGFKKLKKNLKGPDSVDIGVFAKQGSEVVIYAATNEFGTDRAGPNRNITIPERSFLRAGVDENKKSFALFLASQAPRVVLGKTTKKKVLSQLGVLAQGKVQGKIIHGPYAPNKPSTIRIKGSSRPLVNTGRLRQSITFEVGRE